MATPFQNKHAFDPRGFGNYLFNVTEVDPANPGDAKPISSFTKKGLERLMAKHGVQNEINLDKDKETLPNIVDAVLSHYKETDWPYLLSNNVSLKKIIHFMGLLSVVSCHI